MTSHAWGAYLKESLGGAMLVNWYLEKSSREKRCWEGWQSPIYSLNFGGTISALLEM